VGWNERERALVAAAYRMHAADALRLAYLMVGDAAAAEDVMHEAFLAVAARSVLTGAPENFRAYLRRAVVNRVIGDHRSRRRRQLREAAVTAGVRVPAEPVLPDPVVRQDLLAALADLPARQRAAVVLRFYADLSETDVADRLGCRPGTVKSLLSRALVRLREEASLDGYR
jgi:RNA polymerase sigma factor (sigma-70 family)